jgi:hypothetical protein
MIIFIFIGRNDGKIMRGSALLWETRRSFSESEEYKGTDSSGNVLNGTGGLDASYFENKFLKITSGVVRL